MTRKSFNWVFTGELCNDKHCKIGFCFRESEKKPEDTSRLGRTTIRRERVDMATRRKAFGLQVDKLSETPQFLAAARESLRDKNSN